MKKLFLFAAACVTLFTGCDNDETYNAPQQSAITFNSFVNNSIRGAATDLTSANIDNFSVYGFMTSVDGRLFTGERVGKSGGTWSYANTQYWTLGKDYWFHAIAPADDAGWTFTTGADVGDGTIDFTNTGTQDLLYAYTDKVTCSDLVTISPVGFTFNHLLSRVKFKFTNAMGNSNTTLVVKDITISDAVEQATLDVAADTKSWTAVADKDATLTLNFGAVGGADDYKLANGNAATSDHLYLIPQADKTYKLSFTVEVYYGGELANSFNHVDETVPAVNMKPGRSYVFSATLSGANVDPDNELTPIEFSVQDVEAWEDFTETNM